MWMNATDARKDFKAILDRAAEEPVVIIRDSEPAAVVVGVDRYRALVQAYRLAQKPEVLQLLTQDDDVVAGEGPDAADIEREAAVYRSREALVAR